MGTFLIFLLIVITFCLAIFNYRKSYILFFLITIITFLGIGCGVFPALMLNDLESPGETVTQPNWAKKNAIVVLGAGAIKPPKVNSYEPTVLAYSRINETAKLYFSCKKTGHICNIIVSGGDANKIGRSEAIIYQQVLLNLGVNNADIILEQQSLNTYKNAELTSYILNTKSFEHIYLVTAGLHMRRALLYFSNFGIYPTPARSDYIAPMILVIPVGYNFAIFDFIIHEYMGIMRFYIYNYFGWNVKTTSPGAF